jgi:hypothetical protein
MAVAFVVSGRGAALCSGDFALIITPIVTAAPTTTSASAATSGRRCTGRRGSRAALLGRSMLVIAADVDAFTFSSAAYSSLADA